MTGDKIQIFQSVKKAVEELPDSVGVFLISDVVEYEQRCGVYFLAKDNAIVYIGKSIDLHRRIAQHISKIRFDKAFYCETGNEFMAAVLEEELIRTFKPQLNRVFTREI